MKKVLSILTLLILIFIGQEVTLNIDSEETVQQCNQNEKEKSLSYDNTLKKFELGKIPLESLDITARTKPLFKLSNSNKSLLLLKLKEQASQYKISETLSIIHTINYLSLRKCGNQWIYVLRKLII